MGGNSKPTSGELAHAMSRLRSTSGTGSTAAAALGATNGGVTVNPLFSCTTAELIGRARRHAGEPDDTVNHWDLFDESDVDEDGDDLEWYQDYPPGANSTGTGRAHTGSATAPPPAATVEFTQPLTCTSCYALVDTLVKSSCECERAFCTACSVEARDGDRACVFCESSLLPLARQPEMDAVVAAARPLCGTCRNCGAYVPPTMEASHASVCTQLVPCKTGCHALVPVRNLAQHEALDCPAVRVPCQFGCSVPRGELPIHNQAAAERHTASLLHRIETLTQEVESLRFEAAAASVAAEAATATATAAAHQAPPEASGCWADKARRAARKHCNVGAMRSRAAAFMASPDGDVVYFGVVALLALVCVVHVVGAGVFGAAALFGIAAVCPTKRSRGLAWLLFTVLTGVSLRSMILNAVLVHLGKRVGCRVGDLSPVWVEDKLDRAKVCGRRVRSCVSLGTLALMVVAAVFLL